jgi:hypothetical protein
MSTDFAKLIVQADTTDLKLLKTRLSDVERQSIRTDKSNVGLTNSFKKLAISIGGVVTITKTISFLKDATFAASDLSEELSKADAVLGDSFQAVNKFAENAATSIGQSQKDALEAASTFGIFGKSAGLAGDDLGNFSIKFTKLSSDLASFFNTKPEDAVRAISSALRGENEAIRRYGVLLDATSLQQQAFKMGIIDSTKDALTPQQKVLAASELIMKQTTDAQGDFARTSEGLANQQRILQAEFEDTKALLGESLIPVMNDLYGTLIDIAKDEDFINFVKNAVENVGIFAEIIFSLTKNLDTFVIVVGPAGLLIAKLTGAIKKLNIALAANPASVVAAALASVAWAAIEAKKAYDLLGIAKANASKAEDMSREMQELVALKKEIEGTIEQIEQLKGTSFWGTKYEEDLEAANANLESVKKVIQDTNREMQGLPPVTDELSDSTKNLNSDFQNMIDKLQSLSGAEKTESDNQNKLNELMAEGERIRVANLNPMEKLYEEHKKLGKLLDEGAISWETYDRALKDAEEQHEAYLQSEIDLMTRKEELRQQERDSLYNGLLTQEEEINQFYNRKRELILESEAVTEAQRQDLLVRLRKDTDGKLLALQEKSNTSNLKSYETMFDGIMRATSAFGKEQSGFYKTMFVLRQSAALANSLVAIGQGLAESSKVGWPQNIATMAGHIASTAGIIASISSVKFSGKFANGGDIPAGAWGIAGEAGKPEMIQGPAKVISGDDTEEILNRRSGETVINFYDSSGTLVDTFRNKVRSQEFDTVIDDIALRMKERA